MKTIEQIIIENRERKNQGDLDKASREKEENDRLEREKQHLASQASSRELRDTVAKTQGGPKVGISLNGVEDISVEAATITGLDEALGAIKHSLDLFKTSVEQSIKTIASPHITMDAVDLSPLTSSLNDIKKAVTSIKIPEYTSESTEIDLEPVTKALTSLEKKLDTLKGKDIDLKPVVTAIQEMDEAAQRRPNWRPTPVTQFDLNPLRGAYISSAQTVTTGTAQALPTTNATNRRSFILYNNDGTNTLWIGGAGVTSSTGIPVPAGTFSAALDGGNRMQLYGISGSGSLDIRILEMTNDAIGSS